MPDQISAVTLKRYRNLTNRRLAFKDAWGRTKTIEANRGGDFAPTDGLAELIKMGMVEEVILPRGGYAGDLPFSTQRRIPF